SATFIPKPWRAEDILAWVEQAAGRSPGGDAGPEVIGPGGKIMSGPRET
ncbi:response regulator, partial [Methylobacterium hispanicum]